jgi:nucleotide-binding universal stress UspA family protein
MYETILVPTDSSEGASVAVEHAINIAGTYGATLHALYVVDTRMSPISTKIDRDVVIDLLDQSGERPTTPVLDRAKEMNIPAIETIRVGVPHKIIREYIDKNDIDLVVMGTHGRTGLEHTLLGSTTERIVRTVDVPVLTVPLDTSEEPRQRVSGSNHSESIS